MSKEKPSIKPEEIDFDELFSKKLSPEERQAAVKAADKKLAKMREQEKADKTIKAQIDEQVFNAIKETNPYLEAKDRQVELDLEKIRERALDLYISSNFHLAMRDIKDTLFPDYQGLSDQQAEKLYRDTFPDLAKELKKADQKRIKEKIEQQGFNNILITDQRLPLSVQFDLLVKLAKDNQSNNLSPNQYIDSDIGDLDAIQELDLEKITPQMIQYIEDQAKQNKYPKLEKVLQRFNLTLADISKPCSNFKISLAQNYQEPNKDTLNQSAAQLWQKFKADKNQGMTFSEYLNLLRQHLEHKKKYLDDYQNNEYYSWLVAAASPFGVLSAFWDSRDRELGFCALQPGCCGPARGGRPLAVLLEL